MTRRVLFIVGLSCLLGCPAWAQSHKQEPGASNAVTRGDLVQQLEAVLQQCDADSQNFATKADVGELQRLLVQMRAELAQQASRVDSLEQQTPQQKDRVDHTARPGL